MKIKLEIDVPVGRRCTGCSHTKFIGTVIYCGAFDDGDGNLFLVDNDNKTLKHKRCVRACAEAQ